QVIAAAMQFESGVQVGAGNSAVLAGSEHYQVTVWKEVRRGKTPFGEIGGTVRQIPAFEVHDVDAGIVDFDPVRILPVLVHQRGVVDRHELGNKHVCVASGSNRRQQHPGQPPGTNHHASHLGNDCQQLTDR